MDYFAAELCNLQLPLRITLQPFQPVLQLAVQAIYWTSSQIFVPISLLSNLRQSRS